MSGGKRTQNSPKPGRIGDPKTPRAVGPGRKRRVIAGHGGSADVAVGEARQAPSPSAEGDKQAVSAGVKSRSPKGPGIVRVRRRIPHIGKQKRELRRAVRKAPSRVLAEPPMGGLLQTALTFELISPELLNSYERKLRIVDKTGDAQMDANVRENGGILIPLLVSRRDMLVICGERRLASARRIGLNLVPVVYAEDLSELQERKFRIADNKLQEAAKWNQPELRLELGEILIADPNIRIESLGFSISEFDVAIGAPGGEAAAEDPQTVLALVPQNPVSVLGDVYRLGGCIVVCGDARDLEAYRLGLGDEFASLVLTDVPFNLRIVGHVAVRKRARNRNGSRPDEFVMGSGEMSPAEFGAFNVAWMERVREVLRPGSLVYSAIHAKGLFDLETAARQAGLEHINTCVWNKGAGGMGSFYRSQVEFYPFWKVPGGAVRNNIELGRHGRNRTTCWDFPGMNVGGADRARLLAMHPTPKPVAMLKEVILDSTARGEIVLDPFAGSGSSLIAAMNTGRRACLIELDPRYVDTILLRAEAELGVEPVHQGTGLSFAALGRSRKAEGEA